MKNIYRMAAVAATALATLISCGSAGAQNDKKQTKATNHVQELTADSFNQMVYDLNSGEMEYLGAKPAIVDFTASWCGPCRSIAPILEELAKEYQDQIVIYKVDVDKAREIAQAFGITSIPAILYIPLEDEPSMTIGARNKAKFQDEIQKILLVSMTAPSI